VVFSFVLFVFFVLMVTSRQPSQRDRVTA